MFTRSIYTLASVGNAFFAGIAFVKGAMVQNPYVAFGLSALLLALSLYCFIKAGRLSETAMESSMTQG